MNVNDALNSIHAPKGLTSVIDGLMGGDIDSIQNQNGIGKSLEEAQRMLKRAQDAQQACKSDAAYWGYMGDISYWQAVVDILTAADLVGAESLPDIDKPNLSGCVVMDACSKVQKFGDDILAAAKAALEQEQ